MSRVVCLLSPFKEDDENNILKKIETNVATYNVINKKKKNQLLLYHLGYSGILSMTFFSPNSP